MLLEASGRGEHKRRRQRSSDRELDWAAMAASASVRWHRAREARATALEWMGSAWGSLGFHNGVAGARQEGKDARHGGGARVQPW
jgi:hypothetical protein